MLSNPQLDFLESVKDNLENVNPLLIKSAIEDIKNKPMTIALIHKGSVIDRVSIHPKEFRATNIQRLSYINDESILKNKMENNEFGRVNLPGQAIFYGALFTDEIRHNRATAFMETTSMTKDISINEEYFTLSRWIVKDSFQVYECTFQSVEDVNEGTLKSRLSQTKFLSELINNESIKIDALRQLTFFSDEFSKYVNRNNPLNYMITAYFSNMIFNHPENQKKNIGGITYPSVQSLYKGQNIALLPKTVDKYLEFDKAVVMKAERKENNSIIIGKSYEKSENIDEEGNLKWELYDGN